MVEGGGKRKRNSTDSPTSTPSSSLQPSLKKLKTNASSPATPTSASTSSSIDMEFTIDVQILREHKKNLILKLNELRKECDSLKAKKTHVERERDHNIKVLGQVARQWNNLHSDLLQMAKRIGSSETNAASTTTSGSSSSSTNSFIQKLLQDYDSTVSDEDEQKIINALNLRCDKTKKLLEHVLDSILVERQRNDEIIKKIKEETGHHKRDASLYTLREDNNKLKAKTEENEKSLGEYQLKNKQLGNQLDICKDKLMIISQENDQLNSELTALKEEFNLVQRRCERLKMEGRVVKQEESQAQPAQTVVKAELTSAVPQSEVGEKVKSLEEEIATLKAQLVASQQEKHLLMYKLETEESIKQSALYQYLYQQYLSLINCIKSEMGKNEVNNAKIMELVKEKKQILDQKEEEMKKLRETYEKQLIQKEQEKADLSNKLQRSNENAKQEIDGSVWQKRAEEVKKQQRVLQEELKIAKKDKQEILADYETMKGKLSTRNKELEGTKKRIKELSKIVDSYKSLQQEKRELAEVRGKEMFYRDRVKKLEEEVKQLKTTEQGQLVQKHNEEMQEKKDELAFLKSEVDKLTAAIDEYETKISQHEEELRKKEDESANISKEKFQLQRQLNAMTQQKNLVEMKVKVVEEKVIRLDEEKSSLIAKLKSMDDVEKQHQSVHSQMRKEIDKLKSDLLLANLRYNETKVEYDKVSNAGREALLKHEEQQQTITQLEKKLKERDDMLTLMEQKLGSHKSSEGSSSGALSALEDELRMWKTVGLCSQCDRQQKNCVITKCFHAFCKECVQANLQVRNRKCPRCKANYGQQDVKDLFL